MIIETNFVIGAVAKIAATIKNDAGVLADPSAFRLRVKSPSGVLTNYVFGSAGEVIKDAVGTYHALIPLTEAGRYTYRWEADAPNAGAFEGVITVKKSIVI